MDDSEDVQLMMEFRQQYEDEWLKFLDERGLKKEWLVHFKGA